MGPMIERDVMAGGCQTHYAEVGSGETLLLLHSVQPGTSGTIDYRNNIEALSQQYRLIMPDLMGFGQTSLPDYQIGSLSDAFTAHITAFMDVLGIDKAHIAGNSRGGMIAVAIAAAQPERVGRIILLSNAGGGVSPEYVAQHSKTAAAFTPTPDNIRAFLQRRYYDMDRWVSPQVFEQYCANAVVQYARYDAIGGLKGDVPDLRPELARTIHPVLFIFGKNDKGWPPPHEAIDVFLNTPGAIYYCASDCGHHPQTEKPTTINLLIKAFLSGDLDA